MKPVFRFPPYYTESLDLSFPISKMTWPIHLGWPHTAWLSFTEVDKSVVHVIRLAMAVRVERSDRMWSTGEGNGKPLQYSCLENPMNSMKRQNDRILKEEPHRSIGAQYLLEISRGVTPERMKGWSQSKNNT